MVTAIIVAAGSSTRMCGVEKQLIKINNKEVIIKSIQAFDCNKYINEIILVTREELVEEIKILTQSYQLTKPIKYAIGGNTRQKSVEAGLALVSNESDYIAIHDGARPFISERSISNVIEDAKKFGAATLAVKVKDTIKLVNNMSFIESTPNRDQLYICQTPQVFLKSLYVKGIQHANEKGQDYTDDCQIIENIGGRVFITKSEYTNIKITTPEDLYLAEAIEMNLSNNQR